MRLSNTDPSEIDADESSRWNYHYSAGTASVVLELPRLKTLHFLSNEQRLVNIFYTGMINKDPVYHCCRESFHC